jgi:dipeptidyl aminopeptidase/acylaminoacyl peptidase
MRSALRLWAGVASCALFGGFAPTYGRALAQAAITYQKPPAAIDNLITAPLTPNASLSPDKTMLAITQPALFPSIAEVAQPRYRLGGLRFNPRTNGLSRSTNVTDLMLQPVHGGTPKQVKGLPAHPKMTNVSWSPDGKHIAFIQRDEAMPGAGMYLYLVDVATATAHRVGGLRLNTILQAGGGRGGSSGACDWLPDSKALLCAAIPAGRGPAPVHSEVPTGPDISENLGKVAPARTYEDLLTNPEDANIFEYYTTAQLAVVPLNGAPHMLADKGLIDGVSVSPDGKYALISERHRPFSFHVPASSFPNKTFVADLKTGASLKMLQDRPLNEGRPNAPDGEEQQVPGARGYSWRSDAPATLVWEEAVENPNRRGANATTPDTPGGNDVSTNPGNVNGGSKPGTNGGGDQTANTGAGGTPRAGRGQRPPQHDRIFALSAPFTATPEMMIDLPMRIGGITWHDAHLALISSRAGGPGGGGGGGGGRGGGKRTVLVWDPATKETHTLFEASTEDHYKDPGNPIAERRGGQEFLVLTPDSKSIYLRSNGSSPQGDMPFIASMPLAGGTETKLFQSEAPFYADPINLLKGDKVMVRRESITEAPNFFIADLSSTPEPMSSLQQVTHFPPPYQGMALPTKQIIHYKRSDGLELTANLWLPAGYQKSQGPLPTLLEAYPAEFRSRDAAAQVTGSPYRYPRITAFSPVPFCLSGFAVLDSASIPIVGENGKQPNDTYIEQLVEGAKAAIDAGAKLGVVDPKRVGVMGHSYGAFMTANLLAHTDLFRAGIARSGAYNRTLTPYGFQNERRTYWQAKNVYDEMSPFNYADKIKTPILLIHGEADDNDGTFPIQSERFYEALKGQGAIVRLVFLPLEPHSYESKESQEHMLWEMNRWLETYVKPEKPVTPASTTMKAGDR